jgi:predicted hydrocarbon binding protein
VKYAMFIEVLGRELDPATRQRLLRALGRECAIQYRGVTFEKYKGDIKGFLKAVQEPSGWVEKAEYDELAGTIRIIDKQRRCSCPLVSQSRTPADQCDCTLGWQKETYSRILGRPVEAQIEESILRGGKRCVYLIKIS